MTVLTLVRHGETDWNRRRLFQGSTDIPLNDTGRAQAQDAAARLRDELDLDAPVMVVSSDLSRARETAQIIARELETSVPRAYPDLRERAFGEAEGLPIEELAAKWGDWPTADIPGAEPWPEVRTRAIRGMRQIARDVRRQTAPAAASVVCVSHGAIIREIVRHASGGDLPLAGTKLANASISSLLLERDHLRLITFGGIPV